MVQMLGKLVGGVLFSRYPDLAPSRFFNRLSARHQAAKAHMVGQMYKRAGVSPPEIPKQADAVKRVADSGGERIHTSEPQNRFCIYCGQPWQPTGSFCGRCGRPIPPDIRSSTK